MRVYDFILPVKLVRDTTHVYCPGEGRVPEFRQYDFRQFHCQSNLDLKFFYQLH